MTLGASHTSIDRRGSTAPTMSCHMAQMDKRAEPERQPISQAGHPDVVRSEDGFTLLEVVCVLAIVALLAAVLMPNVPAGTSHPRLEAYALETAALFKADRIAAVVRRVQIAAEVNAPARFVRSGATARIVRYPEDVVLDAVLPELCNRRPAKSTIGFLPSGMSCGGTIALSRLGGSYEIRVNWLTGGVDIVSRNAF
jgi:general secretion pathway protein H